MPSWHLARHPPTQILSDHLRIRADTVMQMLRGLWRQRDREVMSGFDPEGGAYGGAEHTRTIT
jgi:urease accessory protein